MLIIGAALVLSSLTACSGSGSETTTSGTAAATDTKATEPAVTTTSETDATKELGELEMLYNPNFKIELLADGIKRVTDGDGRELILVPKSLSEIPAEYADSIVITTPVKNAVFLSSTQVCTFRTVGGEAVLDAVGGVTGSAEAWTDIPAVAERVADGRITDVTSDNGMMEPDYEKIQALEPDVVFVYTGEFGQQATIAKLEELGINYAVDNDYLETSYLARMEWMRFILTFLDADEQGKAAMEKAHDNIETARSAFDGKEKPVIALFNIFGGVVYATGDDSWVGSMISDMGGTNAFGGIDTSSLTMEAAFDVIDKADIIVYTTTPLYCAGMEAIKEAFPQITECNAYENDRVYQYTDIFWNGIDRSDIMACELAAINYPDVFADSEISYFIKLG